MFSCILCETMGVAITPENAMMKSFGWTIRQKVITMEISALETSPRVAYSGVPPWLLAELTLDLGLLEVKKGNEGNELDKF